MKTYYNPDDLAKFGKIGEFGGKELATKFFNYYGETFKDGALSEREKSLIALAVAHTMQCPYCIDAYTADTIANDAVALGLATGKSKRGVNHTFTDYGILEWFNTIQTADLIRSCRYFTEDTFMQARAQLGKTAKNPHARIHRSRLLWHRDDSDP